MASFDLVAESYLATVQPMVVFELETAFDSCRMLIAVSRFSWMVLSLVSTHIGAGNGCLSSVPFGDQHVALDWDVTMFVPSTSEKTISIHFNWISYIAHNIYVYALLSTTYKTSW